jgi:streptomycin 3"-adenylyltransferase
VLERHLGGTLLAIHLFSSALDGGLKPHSDIDLLVTVSTPLPAPLRRALMLDLLSVSAWPGTAPSRRALEVKLLVREHAVPWRYPPQRELQFGEWLREELQSGSIPPAASVPDIAILLSKARQRSLCLAGPPVSELFEPVPREDFARGACGYRRPVERGVGLAGRRAQRGAGAGTHLVQRRHGRRRPQGRRRQLGPRTTAAGAPPRSG